MKVLIATDFKIIFCDGRYFCPIQLSTILLRYHNAFGELYLCARIIRSDEQPKTTDDITDILTDVVAVDSLKNFVLGKYDIQLRAVIAECDLVVSRCPGFIAYKASDIAHRVKKPCFAESMGCAWDAYWNHGIAGKLIAPYAYFKMKKVVYNADYALYVTNEFLQKRYPCKNSSVGASNVCLGEISDSDLEKRLSKIASINEKELVLMTTAAVDVRYKGQEYVIKAIPKLMRMGYNIRYLLAGGGDDTYLKELAAQIGVSDQVVFLGRLSMDEVYTYLEKSDIYIQPSLQEGLPRSVIEAMSKACPCLGAATAGIPELISKECVFKRKSADAIARAVVAVCSKEKLAELAKINHEASKQYHNIILDERRNKYYSMIKDTINNRNN